MKRLILVISLICFLAVPVLASPEMPAKKEAIEEETEKIQSICPVSLIKDNSMCLTCHEVSKKKGKIIFGVKEDKWRNAPYGLEIITNGDHEEGYFKLVEISDDRIRDHLLYLRKKGIQKYTIEINSPGGSVIGAWRIVTMIRQFPEIEVTTTCSGLAASAGFILLASGNHRIASPRAMLMMHELWSMSFLKIETPASSKDEAEVMRLWQDNINSWLAERSKMSAEEINKMIHKKDWWMTGKMAFEKGFIDELIW
jgi:ATP-dependent protease ClpP protease subunit